MGFDEVKKRLQLVDERGENLWKKYPVLSVCILLASPIGIPSWFIAWWAFS